MPVIDMVFNLALSSHCFAAGSGGAKREGVELCFSLLANAIARCIAAASCLFALTLLIESMNLTMEEYMYIIIFIRAVASRCKAARS